jgi:hypothetical protein
MVRLHRQLLNLEEPTSTNGDNTMKIYTSTGRKIKRQKSTYDRFIDAHIQLGADFKTALYKWKMLNCTIQVNYQSMQTYGH